MNSYSPQIFFCVGVEDGFLLPAEGEESLADGLLYIGGDGAFAVVVFVVAFAGVDADEAVLDGALEMMGHVVVHLLESEGHAHGFVGAVLRAAFALHQWIPEVDGTDDRVVLRDIVLQYTTQAMLADWAYLALADSAFRCHFSELFDISSKDIFVEF